MYLIVQLTHGDDFGVYARGRKGDFGTPLVFRGTLADCLTARKEMTA